VLFAHLLTVLFWLGMIALAVGLARRSRLWAVGQPAPIAWASLATIPKRYFVDLHHVVAREPYIANAHVATAGAAVAALILVALNYGLALYLPALDWAIAACAAVMLVGVCFVWLRRRTPPARLSRGPWMRLPYTLGAFAVGLLALNVVPLSLAAGAASGAAGVFALLALVLVLIGAAELAFGIGSGGPMKHAVAGLLHLAFHPRPERFAGKRSTALKPLDLDQKQFGIEKPADFRWNQLLGFDACVQCGKCEAACPAFAAGQPLNPKKLIQDLVVGFSSTSDANYTGSPYPGMVVGQHSGTPGTAILPDLIAPETIWSCTTCRACVEECPMLIEHVDAIVGVRRYQTLALGNVPPQAAAALENLRTTETIGGYARASRYDWAIDLDIRQLQPAQTVDYLLIAGEGAYDLRYQRTLRALVKVLKAAKVDFAILGEAERDCGDSARRLGDEATFRDLAQRTIQTLARYHFRRILTADPHILHCLRNEYPALGGNFEVVHHTGLLAELTASSRLKLRTTPNHPQITYHDPCYLGRYNGETDAPRAVLRTLGIEPREMERSGKRGRCCGGGGGAPLTDIPGKRRIPDIRIEDARAVGAEVVAVACPGCTAMLEGVVAPRPEVLDIAELVAAAVEV
jgi:dimethylglycine catabolism B